MTCNMYSRCHAGRRGLACQLRWVLVNLSAILLAFLFRQEVQGVLCMLLQQRHYYETAAAHWQLLGVSRDVYTFVGSFVLLAPTFCKHRAALFVTCDLLVEVLCVMCEV